MRRSHLAIRLAALCVLFAALFACRQPMFDEAASESLDFRRLLAEEGETVAQFELRESALTSDTAGPENVRFVPSFAVTDDSAADDAEDGPVLHLDYGVVFVRRSTRLEAHAVAGGELIDDGFPIGELPGGSERFNAWDARPAIPGEGDQASEETGVVVFYNRVDDTSFDGEPGGFGFHVGSISGLKPDGEPDIERTDEPLVAESGDSDVRVAGIGLSPGLLSLLSVNEDGAASLRVYRNADAAGQLSGGTFGVALENISLESDSLLAGEAADIAEGALLRVVSEFGYEEVYSALAAADPLGVSPDDGESAGVAIAAAPEDSDERAFRNSVAGAAIDAQDAEDSTVLSDAETVPDAAVPAAGAGSDRRLFGQHDGRFAAYSFDSPGSASEEHIAGTVSHIASVPQGFADTVADENGGFSGDEPWLAYFTHVQPRRSAGDSMKLEVSVYEIEAARLEEL